MSKKCWQIVVPEYPEQIKISEKRRPKYFRLQDVDDIPKRYKDKVYFKEGIAYENVNHTPIVKNTRSVGKPRFERINFQKLWNGTVARHTRAKMADELHAFYSDSFRMQLPASIDLKKNECLYIFYQFSNVYDSDSADLDNLAHWHIKTSLDVLTEKDNPNQKADHKLGIIKDDNLSYIRGIFYSFTECELPEERMLIITLLKVPKDTNILDTLINNTINAE